MREEWVWRPWVDGGVPDRMGGTRWDGSRRGGLSFPGEDSGGRKRKLQPSSPSRVKFASTVREGHRKVLLSVLAKRDFVPCSFLVNLRRLRHPGIETGKCWGCKPPQIDTLYRPCLPKSRPSPSSSRGARLRGVNPKARCRIILQCGLRWHKERLLACHGAERKRAGTGDDEGGVLLEHVCALQQ